MSSFDATCSCHLDFLINQFCIACDGSKLRNKDREATILRNRDRKLPTQIEYLEFDGGHCKQKYKSLTEDWQCPCCNRTRFQLLRWTMRFPKSPSRFEGWVVGLHTHHDHASDAYGGMYTFQGAAAARFAPVIICEQCNSADSSAKKKLRLPENFTFTPIEVKSFIYPTAHGWHIINYTIAQDVYNKFVASRALPKFF